MKPVFRTPRFWLLLLIGLSAVLCRTWELSRLPGINGDEAWYGVQARSLLRGEPVSWRTPSELPLNPVHMVPLTLFEALRDSPHFLTLRIPALLSGLLMMLLALPVSKQLLKGPARLIFVSLVWTLPIHMAYARFGWDASHTPLLALACLSLASQKRWIWLTIGGFFALLVHPTNIFLLPIVVGMVLGERHERQGFSGFNKTLNLRYLVPALGLVGLTLVIALPRLNIEGLGSQALSLEGWFTHHIHYGRLLSGATSFEFIVGPFSSNQRILFDLGTWAILIGAGVFGIPRLLRERRASHLGLMAGIVVSIALLYLVGGVRSMSPGFERYALFVTVPTCLALASLFETVSTTPAQGRGVASGLALFMGLLLITLFSTYYLKPLKSTGGHGSGQFLCFRTGLHDEPKQAALNLVRQESPDKEVIIATESWWLTQPLRYLTQEEKKITVVPVGSTGALDTLHTRHAGPAGPDLYLAGFPGGPFEKLVNRQGYGLGTVVTIPDAGDKPAIILWRLR